MELINHEQISQLVNLFNEFDESDGLNKLYCSTQSSYSELISFGTSLFQPSNKAAALFLMHRIKNQFKNLGMVAALEQLAQIKSRIECEKASDEEDLVLLEKLKEVSFHSFSFIFDNYLD